MKKSAAMLMPAVLLASPHAWPGAVMDMVVRDAAGLETGRSIIYAQSGMIRVDDVSGGSGDGSMIFLGDRMLYLDHRDETYVVLDEAMLDDVSAKIKDAMAEMEKQLAGLPPEQRAMVEQMMQGKMQDMMAQAGANKPGPRVEPMGNGRWQSYDCEKFAVFEGDAKTHEVCAADLDDIEGADEVMKAFRSMAAYVTKLAESMPMMASGDINPGELMDMFDGFPVHSVDYMNGRPVEETSLESVTEKELASDLFAAPDGYRREDPFARP